MLISWMFTIYINKTFVIDDMFDSFHTTSHKTVGYIHLPLPQQDAHSNKVSKVIVVYSGRFRILSWEIIYLKNNNN